MHQVWYATAVVVISTNSTVWYNSAFFWPAMLTCSKKLKQHHTLEYILIQPMVNLEPVYPGRHFALWQKLLNAVALDMPFSFLIRQTAGLLANYLYAANQWKMTKTEHLIIQNITGTVNVSSFLLKVWFDENNDTNSGYNYSTTMQLPLCSSPLALLWVLNMSGLCLQWSECKIYC